MSAMEWEGLDLDHLREGPFGTVLADPPWRFVNRTGKVAPEHRRLARYDTLAWKDIASMPVSDVMAQQSHCYLWVPNALVAEGLAVLEAWGFTYKTMLVWAKRRKDGGPDGRGVGFYFRNVTEPVLFGVRGGLRTLAPGRRQVNMIETCKREHSRKPDEILAFVENLEAVAKVLSDRKEALSLLVVEDIIEKLGGGLGRPG